MLDGVQDPGNVGAIIRTANAFGIKSVMMTEGCADPYNPKTIRASMGAIFRQPIRNVTMPELIEFKSNGASFFGAELREGSSDILSANLEGSIIAIGSEGRGLSREVLSLCSQSIAISIAPGCESLNVAVAAAIFMWEASKGAGNMNSRWF